MGKIYTVTQFNTIDKLLTLLVRDTEQEAREQIEFEMDCLKRKEKVLKSKMDYDPDAKTHLGKMNITDIAKQRTLNISGIQIAFLFSD